MAQLKSLSCVQMIIIYQVKAVILGLDCFYGSPVGPAVVSRGNIDNTMTTAHTLSSTKLC